MNEFNYLSLGKVVGSHGIKGEVKLPAHSGDLSNFYPGLPLMLKQADGHQEKLTVERCWPHKQNFILRLEGVDSRSQADQLVGCEILALRDDLPALEDDTYFWEDIIGLEVVTVDKKSLGSVKTIISTGSNDVYVVVDPDTKTETLVPAIQAVVRQVNFETGIMQVALPEVS